MRSRVAYLIVILACALFVGGAMKVSQAYEGPLSEKKIASYSNIAFSLENFQKVERGMTQEKVLQLLGVPENRASRNSGDSDFQVRQEGFYESDFIV